ncbi:MAG: hypothetical protein K0M45_11875 [Candidatus Paracaedibacteraceae bacterium]|nr:hypothetical protein [Candidatus Paracaedibacteraceae bacterium]
MWFFIFSIFMAEAKQMSPSLSRQDCQRLIVNHKPNNSAEYEAGVNSSDNPVVPPNLPGNKPYGLGDKVTIPLELPLKDFAPEFAILPLV